MIAPPVASGRDLKQISPYGRIGKLLLSLGAGGLLSVCAILALKAQAPIWSEKIEGVLAENQILIEDVPVCESLITAISLLALLIAPLIIFKSERLGMKITGLILVGIMDCAGVLAAAVQGKVTSFMLCLAWGSATYICWLGIDVFNGIRKWMREIGK